jgi:putative Holliday junction resolvase
MIERKTIRSLLAFDFGKRRVGVGLGVPETHTATPLTTIAYRHQDTLWREIHTLIETWNPQLLLVGMPTRDDGKAANLEKPIKLFAATLKKRYDLPIEFINEQLTSLEAIDRLKQQRQNGRKKKVQKMEIDRQAAAILIENWLDGYNSTAL